MLSGPKAGSISYPFHVYTESRQKDTHWLQDQRETKLINENKVILPALITHSILLPSLKRSFLLLYRKVLPEWPNMYIQLQGGSQKPELRPTQSMLETLIPSVRQYCLKCLQTHAPYLLWSLSVPRMINYTKTPRSHTFQGLSAKPEKPKESFTSISVEAGSKERLDNRYSLIKLI